MKTHPALKFSVSIRLFARLIFILAVLAAALPSFGQQSQPVAPPAVRSNKLYLQGERKLAASYSGKASAVQALSSSQAKPLAVAAADLDGHGINDLIIGYATPKGGLLVVHRGNLDAFAPQSHASWLAIGQGRFPDPFLAEGKTIELPEAADFVATGKFDGQGNPAVVVAARGSSVLYIYARDGKGGFALPRQVAVSGKITAVTTAEIDADVLSSQILVGVTTPTGDQLAVLESEPTGFSTVATVGLRGPVTSMASGDLDRDRYLDVAIAAGGELEILHGRDVHAARVGSGSASLLAEHVQVPFSTSSVTLGTFVYDRGPRIQIAALATDGSTHIVTREHRDARPWTADEIKTRRRAIVNRQPDPLALPIDPNERWQVAESFPSVVSGTGTGHPSLLLRGRISDKAGDDVMLIDAASTQMHVLAHEGATANQMVPDSPQASVHMTMPMSGAKAAVAGIPLRVNIDGRPGVVVLKEGQMAPEIMMPLPDPTFFPNRFDDIAPRGTGVTCLNTTAVDGSNDCTLREAILKANATGGTDTIMLQAGTYTLSQARVDGDNTGVHGGLYVNDSLNIVGAGQATTIIQAGTNSLNGVDLVMAVNEDLTLLTDASASISNLTIRFGRNRGSVGVFDGDGGGIEFDTGTSGTAILNLTNVTLTNNSTTDGNGGGLVIFNFTNPGSGLATLSNCIIQNNTVAEVSAAGSGGGIWVTDQARMSMSNSQVLNNLATQVNGGSKGVGGGLFIFSAGSGSPLTVIHASTISGNQASSDGGGIWDASNLLVDQGTTISANTAGGNGGGVYYNAVTPDTATFTKVTIIGNTATGNGGGFEVGEPSLAHSLTMSFSRLAGNTAASGSNIHNTHTTFTATNNWFGTNSAAATIADTSGGTTTFSPFIVLTHTASPSTIRINQSATLTGSFLLRNDTTGVPGGPANLDEIIGLPITFNNAFLGTIPEPQPEMITGGGTSTATFNAGGVGGAGHADAVVDQQTTTANIVILEPLQITKIFNPTTIAVNASSTLTFIINNPNTVAVDANFADTFPAGLVVAAVPALTNACGGAVTATAGAGSVSFSNASLPVGLCTITVAVRGASDGVLNNTVTINSTAAGTGGQSTSNATLTAINPPTIAKAFGAASIPLNGTTSLTLTLTSTNVNLTLNGVAFTDNLPAGLVVATPNTLANTCGGTATAASGSPSVSLSGVSLAPGASCTVSVNVAGTTAGVKNNSTQVTSTNGGTGNTSNASITVLGPPVIIKAFGAASIPLNGSTSLTFTIQNNNATTTLTGNGFTDTLPAGLVVATPNGLTGSCGGGTITATQGTGAVSLSGASLAASSSCTFSVNVTGTSAGLKNNTTGNVISTEGGTGGTASASVKVEAPPSIAKVFNPSTIALNATTSLTFTITNPAANVDPLTGVALTDTLPTGLTVANATATVCGGTVTTTAPTGIAITGATIAVNSQCQFSITVTGAASGQYTNTTGNVTSTNGGSGNTATANLTVATPPTITKAFGAANIPLNGTTSLTFNVTNPNASLVLTGVAFADNLPAGLVIATPNGLTSTCGGTSTAVAGSGSASLSGGTVAASASCTVSLNVTGTTAGVKNNSVQVTSTEGGTGNTSNASITVAAPPVIIKTFGAASIPLNGSTSLTFTIQNNNTTTALAGVGFGDALPAGLAVSTPNGLTGSCGGGTITATQGTNAVSLSGAALAQSTSCTFSVNVTGTAAGTQNNTTGNVTSTNGGTGGTASASVNVVAPPAIAKVFNPSAISVNATTSLTFTITNPAANAVALTGVAFTDTLPTGLTVANASATVCGGTVTTTAPTGIAITGATIATNSQCQFSITVTGAASGQYTNTTGNVTSTNGGTGNTATANLSVAAPPTIAKTFGVANIPLNGTTSLTFSISNPAINTISLTGIAFTDNLPAGLVIATPNGLTSTCGGVSTAVAGSGSASLAGGTLASGSSCVVSVNVAGTTAGVKNNSVQVTSTEGGTGNTSNASVTVAGPPVIIKAFGAASIPLNGSTSLTFTIQNNNTTTALSGVGFGDALPAGLAVSTPNGLTGSCGGGTIVATQGTNAISLAGATLAQSTSCAFSVNVTGAAAGTQNNTTGNVTSTNGGTGGTASASVKVVAPPSIAKVFNPSAVAANGTTSLTFTITNPAANSVALTGVAFTDTLPTGLTVANASATVCGGTLTTTAPTGIALTGAAINTNGQCQFSVTVTGAVSGQYTNTTGNVTSTNGGTGNTATANLSVGTPPSIAKAFGAPSIGLGGSTSLTFTITNSNASLALTGVAFSDALPAGLTVSTPNGFNGTCGTGTITAAGGSQNVSLTGGTIAANSTCTFTVNITGVAAGSQVNTTGAVTATNAGTGNTATASITVLASDLTIAKSHSGSFFQGQTGATYTVTVANAGPGRTFGAVSLIEVPPVGLTVTALSGTGWSCNVGTLSCTRSDALAAAASYPPVVVTVSVAANTAASVTNIVSVSGGGELNTANDSASDATTVTLPPDFALASNPTTITIKAGLTANFVFTVTPLNNAFTNPVTFTISGLPGKTSFVFTPATVTPGANPATSSLVVSTTAGDPFLAQNSQPQPNRSPLFAMLLPFTGLILSGFGLRNRRWTKRFVLGLLLLCGGITLYGCAGGQKNFQNLGTPPGTYTVTVTASSSGTVQHSAPVTLIVQP